MDNPLLNGLHQRSERRDLLHHWLREEDGDRLDQLFQLADRLRRDRVGDEVYLRGLIEMGNHCDRACAYCGLRAANRHLERFRMNREEILDCAEAAVRLGYGTVVLQSGEDEAMSAEWLAGVVREIKRRHDLAVTLSVGERGLDDYRLWRQAGADRYLLKFETSDPELYRRIHPPRKPGEPSRFDLLRSLRDMGYQIGAGVMIGLPGQTYRTLARDIELFAELDLDMIGSGPFIPNPDTPLGPEALKQSQTNPDQVPPTDLMTYKVIALTRILVPDANLPATTALGVVSPAGFERALRAGANVIMPNLTPVDYRALYLIYPGGLLQPVDEIHREVVHNIIRAGRRPGAGRGDRFR